MNSQHVVNAHRALSGPVTFARAAAVTLQGAGMAPLNSHVAGGYRRLDLSEDQVPPGEGCA